MSTNNYRTISLLNTMLKIYEGIIHKRLTNFLEGKKWFSSFQAAYRKSRSTVDHILVLQELFLEYRMNKFTRSGNRKTSPLYWCFIDLRKAFDMVLRSIMFSKLYKCGVRGKMFRVIKDIYSNNKARVLIGLNLSPEFDILSGVLQGSKLGPILFLIFINDLLE